MSDESKKYLGLTPIKTEGGFYSDDPDIQEIINENYLLKAENAKLRAAGECVVKWWLDEGCLPFDGAPYALFALRKALGHSRDKAALENK